jgi:hypothetical protein
LYKKASFSVDLRGSDLGRKWERSTPHNHDTKYAVCVMSMEYIKTWLTPRKYNGGQSFLQSKSLSHATNTPSFMETRGSLPSSRRPTTGYYLTPNKTILPFRIPTTVM